MVGADIHGWATRAESLSELDRSRLAQAEDELERSIDAYPPGGLRTGPCRSAHQIFSRKPSTFLA